MDLSLESILDEKKTTGQQAKIRQMSPIFLWLTKYRKYCKQIQKNFVVIWQTRDGNNVLFSNNRFKLHTLAIVNYYPKTF
ncbi:hypothetical protein DERP_011272 [Dermatophagoides pteronyssinus]|uniref:Uncharacterized protein n=1 Tax=Dermatophagoides pteronyssinus TaxID=6956 RepID=A0ABQ8J7M7_DERPT|nr:hypothetical protein DERP_011272 [Dermatophagoides pteronyssinus]